VKQQTMHQWFSHTTLIFALADVKYLQCKNDGVAEMSLQPLIS